MQKKKGISLIVLVITIIVMVILAGAIILTLNNSGIINKASSAVEETNLATAKEVASLAWAEAYADGARTVEDLEQAVLEAFTNNKINKDDYIIEIDTTGVEVKLAKNYVHKGVVPEGAVYLIGHADGMKWVLDERLLPGDAMPETVGVGHLYYYGDYIYVYGGKYQPGAPFTIEDESFGKVIGIYMDVDFGGWQVVTVNKTKSEYGEIMYNINGKDVTSMSYTFSTYSDDSALVKAPQIPNTVTSLDYTFYGCKLLTEVSNISNTAINLSNMFNGCTALTKVPKIPDTAINLINMFNGCTALTVAPELSKSATDLGSMFSGCTALTRAPEIPETATKINSMFNGCTALKVAPKIPKNVDNMMLTFFNCTSLTGPIEIDANPTTYDGALYLTQITEVTGSTTLKTEILATK